MSEIIVYIDGDFGGLHTHFFDSVPDLRHVALGGSGSGINGDWNDKISSIVVVSGQWEVFRDVNYQVKEGATLSPGAYHWVEAIDIPNDSISSIKRVG